ncbi:MAG: M23 family metallopeptidase, partial [Sphingobacteriales bacterium]
MIRKTLFCISLSLALLVLNGCQPGTLFGRKSGRAAYVARLEESGLSETAMGRQWLTAGARALEQPLSITLPFKSRGFFHPAKPAAYCYSFSVKAGRGLTITLLPQQDSGALLFTELLAAAEDGNEPALLATADSSGRISYVAEKEEQLFLRVQPELLAAASFELTIVSGPSLAFPVKGGAAGDIGSKWGVDRDGGKRRHEGVDIFGRRGTPLVAVADGVVNRVQETRLGGKVVWLRPQDRPISVYYAHLDSQFVSRGQEVKKGEVLGLMGNTGNARTTPPHLHFGIYTNGGAIDPLAFIEPVVSKPPAWTGDLGLANRPVRTTRKVLLSQAMSGG